MTMTKRVNLFFTKKSKATYDENEIFALLRFLPAAMFLTGGVFWDFQSNLRRLNFNKVAMCRRCRCRRDEDEEEIKMTLTIVIILMMKLRWFWCNIWLIMMQHWIGYDIQDPGRFITTIRRLFHKNINDPRVSQRKRRK